MNRQEKGKTISKTLKGVFNKSATQIVVVEAEQLKEVKETLTQASLEQKSLTAMIKLDLRNVVTLDRESLRELSLIKEMSKRRGQKLQLQVGREQSFLLHLHGLSKKKKSKGTSAETITNYPCDTHPQKRAIVACNDCGRFICKQCIQHRGIAGSSFCSKDCWRHFMDEIETDPINKKIDTRFAEYQRSQQFVYYISGSIIAVLLIVAIAYMTMSAMASRYYNLGRKERKKLVSVGKRIEYLENAVYYSSKPMYTLALAQVYLEDKQYDKAYAKFQEVLKKQPDDVEASYGIALAALELKLLKEAERLSQKYLALSERNAHRIYFNLGTIYAEQKIYPLAAEYFTKASTNIGYKYKSYLQLAQLYENHINSPLKTIDIYEKLNRLHFNLQNQYKLINLYKQQRNYAKIISGVKKIFRHQPNIQDTDIFDDLRDAYVAMQYPSTKRITELLRLLKQAGPNKKIGFYLSSHIAELYKKDEQHANALRYYRRASQLHPEDIPTYRAQLPLLKLFSRWQKLYQTAHLVIAKEQPTAEILHYLIDACIALDKMAEAQKYIYQLPKNITRSIYNAEILYRRHQTQEAIQLCQKLLRRHPRSATIRNYLGYLLLHNDNFARAVAVLVKAISATKDNAEGEYYLAIAYLKLGYVEFATRWLTLCSQKTGSIYSRQAEKILAVTKLGLEKYTPTFLQQNKQQNKTCTPWETFVAQKNELLAMLKFANDKHEQAQQTLVANNGFLSSQQCRRKTHKIAFCGSPIYEQQIEVFFADCSEKAEDNLREWRNFLMERLYRDNEQRQAEKIFSHYQNQLAKQQGIEKLAIATEGIARLVYLLAPSEITKQILRSALQKKALRENAYKRVVANYQAIALIFSQFVDEHRLAFLGQSSCRQILEQYERQLRQQTMLLEQFANAVKLVRNMLEIVVTLEELGV